MAMSKTTNIHATDLNLRHVWLASLGLAAITRREAGKLAAGAADAADRVQRDALRYATDARDVARGGAMVLRERIEPKFVALRADIETRLASLIAGKGRPAGTRSRAKRGRSAARNAPRTTAGRKAAR